MKNIMLSIGTNVYDFFIIPTIRFTKNNGIYTYLTVEWLKWYIDISWE